MNLDAFEQFKKSLGYSPNIQGRGKYLNSAVLVPFVWIEGEYHLLFQKRAHAITQGGDICFPGGRHDPALDKNFKETAIRETVEELGINARRIEIIGQLDTVVAPMGAIVEPYVGVLHSAILDEMNIDEKEVEKVFTLPFSHFKTTKMERYHVRLEIQPSFYDKSGDEITLLPSKELGLPEKYHQPWGGHKFPVFAYKTEHGVIWGITAEIIYELLEK